MSWKTSWFGFRQYFYLSQFRFQVWRPFEFPSRVSVSHIWDLESVEIGEWAFIVDWGYSKFLCMLFLQTPISITIPSITNPTFIRNGYNYFLMSHWIDSSMTVSGSNSVSKEEVRTTTVVKTELDACLDSVQRVLHLQSKSWNPRSRQFLFVSKNTKKQKNRGWGRSSIHWVSP